MNIEQIHQFLIDNADDKYSKFQRKLIFTKSNIMGVRMPILRNLAKELANTTFIDLPLGKYLEYDYLQALMICYRKDSLKEKFNKLIEYSYSIDNWSTCDTIPGSTKFKENELEEVFSYIKILLSLHHSYSNRLGVIFLMKYFINYDQEVIFDLLKVLPYGDYYLDMGVAWYYSVLLAKRYDIGLSYVCRFKDISEFVYKKSIQKAIESFRVSDEHKKELKLLRK